MQLERRSCLHFPICALSSLTLPPFAASYMNVIPHPQTRPTTTTMTRSQARRTTKSIPLITTLTTITKSKSHAVTLPTSTNSGLATSASNGTSPSPLFFSQRVHAVRRTYADERSNCVRIRFPIFYVTVRDQLLSPLVQGAVWGLGGLLLTQLRQYISARAKGAGLGKPATATKASSGSVLRSLGLNKR